MILIRLELLCLGSGSVKTEDPALPILLKARLSQPLRIR